MLGFLNKYLDLFSSKKKFNEKLMKYVILINTPL